MSGECDECGEHAVDCTCNEESVSSVFLRDEIDRALGLVRCLFLLMEHAHQEVANYSSQPHHDLYLAIEDKLTGIEKALRNF
jgi:hypothetical protein